MNAQKTGLSGAPTASRATTSVSARKWVKRSPAEIVIEQINKAEQTVGKMREELAREERELSRLQQAKRILESE